MGFNKRRNEEQEEFKEQIVSATKDFAEKAIAETAEKSEVVEKPVAKPVEDTERKLNLGITGDTVEVRDFRAIVKKQGKQINIVLTGILNEWNSANYNL